MVWCFEKEISSSKSIRELMTPISITDVESVYSLVKELKSRFPDLKSQGFNWTDESLKSELMAGKGVGIWEQGTLIAFILFRDAVDVREITLLCTDPRFQRSGVMKKLFIGFAALKPYKEIWLEVHEKNSKALNFYKKMNFEETGRRPRYYADGSDAILMIYRDSNLANKT